MARIRKQYRDAFKFKVALEAIKGLATINEIASQHDRTGLHSKSALRASRPGPWARGLLAAAIQSLFGHTFNDTHLGAARNKALGALTVGKRHRQKIDAMIRTRPSDLMPDILDR